MYFHLKQALSKRYNKLSVEALETYPRLVEDITLLSGLFLSKNIKNK